MQIEWMKCFLALAEYHNFSVASEYLYISQSTLSKRIQAMERELDVVLFNREARTVTLTSAGERIRFWVEKIVNDYDDMLSYITDISDDGRRLLMVSSMCDMGQYGITNMIIRFEQEHNGVIAETKEQSHGIMAENLEQRKIICAIGYWELIGNVRGYHVTKLKLDPLVLVYSRQHPLAKKNSPNLGDAKFYRFCFPKEDMRFFEFIIRLCARVGFSPELTKSDVRISTIREYILQGMRLTITTESRAKHIFSDQEFMVTPLEQEDVLQLALFVREDVQDSLYDEFKDYVENYYCNERDYVDEKCRL